MEGKRSLHAGSQQERKSNVTTSVAIMTLDSCGLVVVTRTLQHLDYIEKPTANMPESMMSSQH